MVRAPKTVDEYLSTIGDEKRAALERLRRIIQEAAPRAEECISYGLPAFRMEGKAFLWYGAAAKHCAVYGAVDQSLQRELEDYDSSGRGTIRFQPDNPLPATVIRKLVRLRIKKARARS